jgi:VanZ family protein
MNLTRIEWGVGIALLAAATVLCLVPGQELPRAFSFSDKLSHVVGHGALAAYFSGLLPRQAWWKIFLYLLLFGVAIEIAQHYMQVGRNGDARDVLANSAGVALGLMAGWAGLWRWPSWVAWLLGRREPAQ